ncbi:MAG: 2Fe-2S iron-sulfur cluster-binding protein [Rhodomicrobiaceae bacterium]
MTRIALTVNGQTVEADTQPRTHLVDFLREHLDLTGTHIGCEHGICGACTVVMNGAIVRSCITFAVTCDGAQIETIESFDNDPLMARLREGFSREHALQCGYCTPGMLITARDLLLRKTGLGENDIRREMSGNLCRCTGYMGIVRAIQSVMADGVELAPTVPANGHLGPAPSPGAPTAAPHELRAAQTPARPQLRPAQPSEQRPSAGAPIEIIVGKMSDRDGFTEIPQHFVLPHPPEDVWVLMSDLRAVADAMPGAALDESATDEHVTGRMSVRVGPMRPSFAGEATVRKDAAKRRVEIEGSGRDRKSASAAQGRIVYSLSPADEGAATRVDIAISYKLSGMLAQFGRADLVRDVVQRLGAVFAQNIDARLSGGSAKAAPEPGGVNILALLWSVLAAKTAAFFRRLIGAAQPPR